jgi:putative sigma-54 modulation protein
MNIPLQITFKNIKPSAAIEARTRDHVERLERSNAGIARCAVTIEAGSPLLLSGTPFSVRIDLAGPARTITVRNEGTDREACTDVYVALRDAFDSARRLVRRQDHDQWISSDRHKLPESGPPRHSTR